MGFLSTNPEKRQRQQEAFAKLERLQQEYRDRNPPMPGQPYRYPHVTKAFVYRYLSKLGDVPDDEVYAELDRRPWHRSRR